MKARLLNRPATGFTLLETIIVMAIIALLAALVIHGSSPRLGKRRATEAAISAIDFALECYHEKYGEYPEPTNPDQTVEVMPGKVCRIGAAKCLYQALTSEGNDAIKGAAGEDARPSDGDWDDKDLAQLLTSDTLPTLRRKIGNHYLLVDGYGRPFQYIKADPAKKNTLNTTYDLWSYGDDETHLRATSKDTEADPSLGAKWIKNW